MKINDESTVGKRLRVVLGTLMASGGVVLFVLLGTGIARSDEVLIGAIGLVLGGVLLAGTASIARFIAGILQ